MRLGAPVARLLSEILETEGYPATAGKIADAIKLQVTVEAPLAGADYEAIAEALSRNAEFRAVLLQEHVAWVRDGLAWRRRANVQTAKPNGRLGLPGRGASTLGQRVDDWRMTLILKRVRWRLSPAARRARAARAQRVAELSLAKRAT